MCSKTVTCMRIADAGIAAERFGQGWLVGVGVLLFAGSAALTIRSCESMSAMGGMPMPGGWTMSMMWMRMPGQTWVEAAGSFVGMWVVMMVAMMLPSFLPALWKYRQTREASSQSRLGGLMLLAGMAYFVVWGAVGVAVFPLGVTLASLAMELPEVSRAIPVGVGVVVLGAGVLQFTKWKAHHLECCRNPLLATTESSARSAFGYGLRLGLHCSYGCAGLTAVLLVIGVMDIRVMAVVSVAITSERLASGERVARAIGAIAIAAGLLLLTRGAGAL